MEKSTHRRMYGNFSKRLAGKGRFCCHSYGDTVATKREMRYKEHTSPSRRLIAARFLPLAKEQGKRAVFISVICLLDFPKACVCRRVVIGQECLDESGGSRKPCYAIPLRDGITKPDHSKKENASQLSCNQQNNPIVWF